MNEEMQIFKNAIFEVAIKLENGEWTFDLETVAKSLGFTENKNNKEYVMWRRVNQYLMPFGTSAENIHQVGKGDFIPEAAVYKLAFKASNEVAEKFQDWLATEVIPSIRKYGSFMTEDTIEKALTNPDFLIQLATKLKDEKIKNQTLEFEGKKKDQLIGELKPKADYVDSILKNKGLVTITQIAKDYGMSGEEMNDLLHDLGIQFKQSKQWLLYSKYHNKGYTHSETFPIKHKNGIPDVKMNTKWTQKGRLFIYDLLKAKRNMLPIIESEVT